MMINCPTCGYWYDDSFPNCTKCGSQNGMQQNFYVPPPAPASPEMFRFQPPDNTGKSKGPLIAVICILIILLIGGIAAGVFIAGHSGSSDTAQDSHSSVSAGVTDKNHSEGWR